MSETTILPTPETAAVNSPAVDPKPATLANPDLDASPNTATDKHVTEALERKKQKKHPVEARIGELTARALQAEKDKAELEAKLSAQAAPVAKPSIANYNDYETYQADLELWAANEVARKNGAPAPAVTPTVAAPAPKVEPTPAKPAAEFAPEFVQMRREEFDGFLEETRQYATRNPDFISAIEDADKRGINFSDSLRFTGTRMKAPQVFHYLAKPENDGEARRIMALPPIDQAVAFGRIAERLSSRPSDFVSNAPPPGRRLYGNAQTDVRPDEMSTDDYLRRRAEQFRTGERRRRR